MTSRKSAGTSDPVTAGDMKWFAEHGWWISAQILPDEQLDELEYGIERFYSHSLDWQLPAVPPGDSGPGAPVSATRQNDYVSLQVAEIRSFVLSPALGSLAAAVGGHEAVRLFHDQLISKAPGPAVVGWHTDRSYWLTCSSTEMLTIWVPLQDVDDHNGSLRVVDGSHRWDIDHNTMRGFHDPAGGNGPCGWPQPAVRSLSVERGQVSVHHACTIHGSGPNLGDHTRIALAIHLQPVDNHYMPPPPGAPALHFNDVLCRRTPGGWPDYSDPHVCPVVGPGYAADVT